MVLPTDHQATEPVQPSEQSLDVPSLAIATQRTAILCGLASATAVRRDQFDVVFPLEPLVQPVTVVGPVANQFCRELVEKLWLRTSSTSWLSWGEALWILTARGRL